MRSAPGNHEIATHVEAYSGGSSEESPRVVFVAGRPVDVEEVIDEWREPRGRYFRVLLANGSVRLLLCHGGDGSWWDVLGLAHER